MIMKDKNGTEIKPGTCFRYRCGPCGATVIAKVIRKGRGIFISFEDDTPDIRAIDFWNPETDENISEVVL